MPIPGSIPSLGQECSRQSPIAPPQANTHSLVWSALCSPSSLYQTSALPAPPSFLGREERANMDVLQRPVKSAALQSVETRAMSTSTP